MKPRNREVNIFNMSVLDLLTGALGAFCFLTLALFPSYFKTQKSSAPDQQQQLGKTKKGIPPFSLAEIFIQDDKGRRCGVLRLDDLKAPHGNKSFRQLPFAAGSEGYESNVYLFMFDPGHYDLTITARVYRTSSPCHLLFNQHTPKGSLGRSEILTDSPRRYVLPLDLKPEQLITNILPRR